MRARRLPLAVLAACLPVAASANGAMGLAYEIFEYRFWVVYVAVTVLLEAIVIGRGSWLTWLQSIWLSVLANALTALG